MQKHGILLIVCAFLILASCTKSSVGPSLEDILSANPKLQVVLDKFQDDPLKHRAAVFLIENLPFHYSYEGEALNDYLKLFELHGKGTMYPDKVLDSIKRACGPFHMDRLEAKSDIYIDPAYLIENIEWAFKVWREQPWGKNVSFDDFCEFILPYRVGDERLEPWRERIYNKYNQLLDGIRELPEAEDPKYVSQVLMDSLHKAPVYFTELFSFGPHYGPKVVDWRSGSCVNFTDLQLYVFRALGLPCSEEIMLMRGNKNVPHYWNAAFDKDGNSYRCSILDPTSELNSPDNYWDPKGKVYRRTFSVNRGMILAMGKKPEERHPSFRYPCFRDVTAIYAGSKNRTLTIGPENFYSPLKKGEPVYLCSASFMDWAPIGWCLYDKQLGAVFEDVEGQVIFRLGTYENGSICPQSDPFLLDRESGEVRFFPSGGREVEVTLLHKYELYFEPFVRRMVDGVFEGSNDPHFNRKDTLFIIKEFPERLWNVAQVNSARSYRYVRYYGPKDSYCNISEAAFYASAADSVPLKGKIIGTPGCNGLDGSHEYTNVFDGDPYTSFDYARPTGGWSGLDLGAPQRIEKIVFTPRNRDNFIRTDDEYELFYYNNGEWTSAGRVRPHSDSLLYKVPEGALLYLKDHTRGKDERIFEYKNGKQQFW